MGIEIICGLIKPYSVEFANEQMLFINGHAPCCLAMQDDTSLLDFLELFPYCSI